ARGQSGGQGAGDVLHDRRGRIIDGRVGPSIRIAGKVARCGASPAAAGHLDAILSVFCHDDAGRLSSRWEWQLFVDESDARQILGYRTHLPERVWAQISPGVTALVTAV